MNHDAVDATVEWLQLDIDVLDLIELGLVEELPGCRYQLTDAGVLALDGIAA